MSVVNLHPCGFGPMPQFDNIPDHLKQHCLWCVWIASKKSNGKYDKIPYNAPGQMISTANPSQWLTYEQAKLLYEQHPGVFNGVGVIIRPEDDLTYIDVDNELLFKYDFWMEFPTYIERSPSGNGLRIISRGRTSRDIVKPVEVYCGYAARFVTITGDKLNEHPVADCSNYIEQNIIPLAPVSKVADVDMPEPIQPNPFTPETFTSDDRSSELMRIYLRLLHSGLSIGEVLGVAYYSPDVFQMALDHRGQNADKVLDYLWTSLTKAIPKYEADKGSDEPFSVLPVNGEIFPINRESIVVDVNAPTAGFSKFIIPEDVMDRMAHPTFVYPDVLVLGTVNVVCSPPEGGKTAIMMEIARGLVAAGYEVSYFLADVSGPDAKFYHEFARKHGINLYLPDLTEGLSMLDVVAEIKAISATSADLTKQVFQFDTLKKMTDVIQKKESKALYNVFRSLSGKGATIQLAAHTNKYLHEDEYIYEGTGDLRSDVDTLSYLHSMETNGGPRQGGELVMSLYPGGTHGKNRSGLNPCTFTMDHNRIVTKAGEFNDVRKEEVYQALCEHDQDAIDSITEALKHADRGQSAVVRFCAEDGISRRNVLDVLKHHIDRIWSVEQGGARNRKTYTLLNGGSPDRPAGDSNDSGPALVPVLPSFLE